MIQNIFLLVLLFSLSACGLIFSGAKSFSQAEIESGYTYVPVDPFPVVSEPGEGCKKGQELSSVPLLQSLPDNAIRMLIEQFDTTGKVTYGPSNLGATAGSYKVTIDYVNSDTINQKIWVTKTVLKDNSDPYFSWGGLWRWLKGENPTKTPPRRTPVSLLSAPDFPYFPGSEVYNVTSKEPKKKPDENATPKDREEKPDENATRKDREEKVKEEHYSIRRQINIPVYVGIGLRVAANIEVFDSKANISGLSVIGAEAEVNRLKGSLVVQTLGVNGKSVAAALPLQSELNRTTAQNAIIAVSSIKALLNSGEALLFPRIVGLYLPFPGGKPLVNALIREFSQTHIPWKRTCPVQPSPHRD